MFDVVLNTIDNDRKGNFLLNDAQHIYSHVVKDHLHSKRKVKPFRQTADFTVLLLL